MKFQLRFLGSNPPDPETLLCTSLNEAVIEAQSRLALLGLDEAVLMSEGFVVRTFPPVYDTGAALDDQTLANAGIYRFPMTPIH